MKLDLKTTAFRVDGKKKFRLRGHGTDLGRKLYRDEAHYGKLLEEYREEIDELQQKLYADNRRSVLLVFQAMDGAGKDSTIRHVMTGVNPAGVHVTAFKRPSEEELDHDFLWRLNRALPERGRIGIFNRSHYEEVLVCRVHPEIITQGQRLPRNTTADMKRLWKERYRSLRAMERHLHENGTQVVKFFLHVSKDEQKKRFLARIDDPAKNWKFSAADLKERALWPQYMEAYEEAVRETATEDSPWYVVPADDKLNMRLIVSQVVLDTLEALHMAWPRLDKAARGQLEECRLSLMEEKD